VLRLKAFRLKIQSSAPLHTDAGSFSQQLDRAIARSEEAKVVMIEAQAMRVEEE
jgi:hypothetical protein